jgi:hypothetical protein
MTFVEVSLAKGETRDRALALSPSIVCYQLWETHMPMIDVYARAGTFDHTHRLARDLAAAVMRWPRSQKTRASREL